MLGLERSSRITFKELPIVTYLIYIKLIQELLSTFKLIVRFNLSSSKLLVINYNPFKSVNGVRLLEVRTYFIGALIDYIY